MDPICLAFSRGCCFYDANSCPHGRHDIYTEMVPLHMAAPVPSTSHQTSRATSRASSPHSIHERSANGRDRSDHSRYDNSDHGRSYGGGSISNEEKKRPPSSSSVLRTSFSSSTSSVARTNQTRPNSSATSTVTNHRKPSMTAVVRPSTATTTATITRPVSIVKASFNTVTTTAKPTSSITTATKQTSAIAAAVSAATAAVASTSSSQSATLTDSNLQKHQRNSSISTRMPPPPPSSQIQTSSKPAQPPLPQPPPTTASSSNGKHTEKDNDHWISDNRSEAEISVISDAFSSSYGNNPNVVFPKPGQPRFMKSLAETAELLIIKLQYLTRPDVMAELLLLVRLEGICQDIKMILDAMTQRSRVPMIAEMNRLKGLVDGIEAVLDAIVVSEYNAVTRVPWIWVNAGGKTDVKTGSSVVTTTTAATATRTHKLATSTLGMGNSNKLAVGHPAVATAVKSLKTIAAATTCADGENVSSRPLAQLALDVMQEAIETIAQIKQAQKNIQSTAMQVCVNHFLTLTPLYPRSPIV